MKQWFLQMVRRALQARSAKVLAPVLGALAVVIVFAAFGAAPAAAQGTTTPPACSTQIMGTRFTLPDMLTNEEAIVPPASLVGASALCIEGLEGVEGVAIKLEGTSPYTVLGNGTPLTVDDENAASLALGDPSFNGSLLKATPSLPKVVKIVAMADLSQGVTVWVGNPRPTVVAQVTIDQWQDIKIPGSLGELSAGTSKWAGNGVTILVTSGAAYSANGAAILPEVGKVGKYEFFVDAAMELKLVGTVPGQRFYLAVSADGLDPSAWLQRRVDPAPPATNATGAASTAGAQYTNIAGACFSSATCTASQAVACSSGAPKLPCTPGDSLSVWRPMRVNPRTHPVN